MHESLDQRGREGNLVRDIRCVLPSGDIATIVLRQPKPELGVSAHFVYWLDYRHPAASSPIIQYTNHTDTHEEAVSESAELGTTDWDSVDSLDNIGALTVNDGSEVGSSELFPGLEGASSDDLIVTTSDSSQILGVHRANLITVLTLERDPHPNEPRRYLNFQTGKQRAEVLTPASRQLIETVAWQKPSSCVTLASRLERSTKAVIRHVETLSDYGLLRFAPARNDSSSANDKRGLRPVVPYDRVLIHDDAVADAEMENLQTWIAELSSESSGDAR